MKKELTKSLNEQQILSKKSTFRISKTVTPTPTPSNTATGVIAFLVTFDHYWV